MRQDPPRWLIIAAIVALSVFIVVAAGLALSTFRQRAGSTGRDWTPAPTRGPATAIAAATAPAAITAAATAAATAAPSPTPAAAAVTATAAASPTSAVRIETPTAPPTETLTPTPGASPTATAAAAATATASATPCGAPLALELSGLYNRAASGCPTGDTAVVWAAWETFERGSMLWRSDTDTAYVFLADGRWYALAERWDGTEPPGRGEPPAGLQAPQRGFGWAWGTDDALFTDLGWATDTEQGFCAQVQPFEHGFLLRSSAAASCTSEGLYNYATAPEWGPVTLAVYDEGWRAARPPDVIIPGGAAGRPEGQGLFPATQAAITLDGAPDEWPDAWIPAAAIVEGAAAWRDETDLSAAFQVAWGRAGLYLAVVVVDDLYRAGPPGTDLWQGDGVEINFDRDLAADYGHTESDADDYQIGIGFGPEMALPFGYRWLPFAQEGPLGLDGAAMTTEDGYTCEVLIPWSIFGLAPAALAPGLTYGFNVALNDNDSDAPAQQTVASASPGRTTYDNPTQWGTLVLQ